jgi:hypothetical protein
MRRAYQLIFAAVAALSAAGVALAQDHAGEAFFGHSDDDGVHGTAGPPARPAVGFTKRQKLAMADALQDYKLACEPDRATLCSDKMGAPADRCLIYYRLKLSSPCKQAMTQLELAQRGAL